MVSILTDIRVNLRNDETDATSHIKIPIFLKIPVPFFLQQYCIQSMGRRSNTVLSPE